MPYMRNVLYFKMNERERFSHKSSFKFFDTFACIPFVTENINMEAIMMRRWKKLSVCYYVLVRLYYEPVSNAEHYKCGV